ncbi:MAG: hypothetical protein QOD83_3884 [Solirubrobacteraceae bacterium]|jgi:plastocyanin|nr:hypothetical protein [Solirubrobacteraceae bacterium]
MEFRKNRFLAIATVGVALAAFPAAAVASDAYEADIEVEDRCDPATFNAVVGPGACVRPAGDGGGNVTVDEFVADLTRKHQQKAWKFDDKNVTIRRGEPLRIAMTRGGERHTVTEVPSFGLGCIPSINVLVFPDQDPTAFPAVCDDPLTFQPGATVPGGTSIRPGESFSITGLTKGIHRYICVIHPWMKSTVKVR